MWSWWAVNTIHSSASSGSLPGRAPSTLAVCSLVTVFASARLVERPSDTGVKSALRADSRVSS